MKQNRKLDKCHLCKEKVTYQFTEKVFCKYEVSYFKCETCGLLQTENPYWLKEAYSSAIADADTGLLSRNLTLSKITAGIIYFLFNKDNKHLDYAGGYGVFTRLMRDMGIDYYWDDPMSENIFAKGFEAEKGERYQVVTAFEFLEHIQDPIKEINNIFKKYNSDAFLFSTMLYKEPIDRNWWYFAFNTGQHISFYNLDTLSYIAKELNFKLYSNGVNVHLLTKKTLPEWKFIWLTRLWPLTYLWIIKNMKSKTFNDHLNLLNKK